MKTLVIVGGLIGTAVLAAIIVLVMAISFHNKEVALRNQISAKQTDNKNEMDRMWKIIDQNAQVTQMQKDALMDIFNSYAKNRNVSGGGLATWVHEAVPNVDQKTFGILMNTITSQRESFAMRQKEILDYGREHDNLIMKFPGVVFASIMGRQHINIVIVTSTRTEEAFKTGKDDDTSLIHKPTPAEK